MAGQTFATKSSFSLIGFLFKHSFWIMFIIFIIPPIITSVHTMYQTGNPLYPALDLGLKLFSGDSMLQKDVDTLSNNISSLIGMEKPISGIFKTIKYYWLFFWNVIFRIFGDVYFIFFPLIVIYRLIGLRGKEKIAQNIVISSLIFLLYLFFINSIILVHGLVTGNTHIEISSNSDKFQEYYSVFKYMIPFHGLISLIKYLTNYLI